MCWRILRRCYWRIARRLQIVSLSSTWKQVSYKKGSFFSPSKLSLWRILVKSNSIIFFSLPITFCKLLIGFFWVCAFLVFLEVKNWIAKLYPFSNLENAKLFFSVDSVLIISFLSNLSFIKKKWSNRRQILITCLICKILSHKDLFYQKIESSRGSFAVLNF